MTGLTGTQGRRPSFLRRILADLLGETMLEAQNGRAMKNILRNSPFLISAAAYLCMYIALPLSVTVTSAAIMELVLVYTASQLPDLWGWLSKSSTPERILSVLSAIGIALQKRKPFLRRFATLGVDLESARKLLFGLNIYELIADFGVICALLFVSLWCLVILRYMKGVLANVYAGVGRGEASVYIVLYVLTVLLILGVYTRTQVMYGTAYSFDLIYTSDSTDLMKTSVYTTLIHGQNDFRQALFAVFAAPVVGIPYLIGDLLKASPGIVATLVISVQIILFMTANLMLAKAMQLTPIRRLCVMTLFSATYMYLLFSIMPEQYLFAYFWLVLCLYRICEKKHPDKMAIFGAGGTLLTSMILVPTVTHKSWKHDFKACFKDMVLYGFEFIFLMLAFARANLFLSIVELVKGYATASGASVAFASKLHQYTSFFRNCLLAPAAAVGHNNWSTFPSWQLLPGDGVCWTGVAVFVLCLFSAWLNRDKVITKLSAFWVGFSFVLLFVLGWGTAENGLILYSLYFGWAVFVLLFQLIERLAEALKLEWLVPVLSVVGVIALLVVNLPGLNEMLRFAVRYYPV